MNCLFEWVTVFLLLLGKSQSFPSPPSSTMRRRLPLHLSSSSSNNNDKAKTIILVRHGCTFMNEYLSQPGKRWGDSNFTDVFHESELHLYRDTPLSPKGVQQANKLSSVPRDKYTGEPIHVSQQVQLVVTSPLTRALQTTELGIVPHLIMSNKPIKTPIVALPLAAERLYLISDMGSPISKLVSQFPFVDFESEFHHSYYYSSNKEEWWYTHNTDCTSYEEWRPNGQGQQYYCPGEPDSHFQKRMEQLYDWLYARTESVIALVCHYGVIEYLTGGQEFGNCEMASFTLNQLTRSGLKYSMDHSMTAKL